jgi:hypothetical protein
MDMITAIIHGDPPTVTAQQKGVMVRGGRPMFFTKKKVADAQDALVLQLRQWKPRQPVEFPVLDQDQVRFPRHQVEAARAGSRGEAGLGQSVQGSARRAGARWAGSRTTRWWINWSRRSAASEIRIWKLR